MSSSKSPKTDVKRIPKVIERGEHGVALQSIFFNFIDCTAFIAILLAFDICNMLIGIYRIIIMYKT